LPGRFRCSFKQRHIDGRLHGLFRFYEKNIQRDIHLLLRQLADEICLFDPVVWKMKCILTSRAIQSRYIDICKLAKKKMYIPLDILLVEPEQPMKPPVSLPPP